MIATVKRYRLKAVSKCFKSLLCYDNVKRTSPLAQSTFQCLQIMAFSSKQEDQSASGYCGYRNRLGKEKSPYLLQHANNPVNWYPWGNEAFEEARKNNKPIFLSVGYSTCHWCHVMEKESFENEEIGKILNNHFVAIKVDREERPDVDRVYMTFVQATQGGGGWPMSVWLTPDLRPIVGGTYFPPEDRYYGRPGFKTILNNIAETWEDNRDGVQRQADAILDALKQAVKVKVEKDAVLPHCPDVVKKCYNTLATTFDPVHGGFSRAPKFPQPVILNFMFRKYADERETEEGKLALKMTLETLRKMAMGGMHDHIGQGFHRYSTDDEWHVPHFEKMLYDQAQLATVYATACQISKEDLFADTVRDILAYVNSNLSDKDGGFYSAEDADSLPTESSKEKKEGAFCVWTYDEVSQILNKPLAGKDGVTEADVFCFHFNVQKDGNVDPLKDPHGELTNQNVLIVKGKLSETAAKFNLSCAETQEILKACCQKLFTIRQQRPKPHLDNKILASWNGLMISGFAHAAKVLQDESYIRRALEAIEFIRKTLFQPDNDCLLRSCYFDSSVNGTVLGPKPIQGFVDDYAMLIAGLLDTYEVCFDETLLQFAEKLQRIQDRLFWDKDHSGYYTTPPGNESEIVLRLKEDQDGAEPSSNSISCHNLLRLAMFTGQSEWTEQALRLMGAFADRLTGLPVALPEMVGGMMFHFNSPKQIIICGDLSSDDTKALVRCVHSPYLPNKVVIVCSEKNEFLHSRLPVLKSMDKIDGKATAFVCKDFTCQLPVTSVEDLEKLLLLI